MLLQLVCFAAMFLVVKENRGNLYLLADCHAQQCQIVILRKATPWQIGALVQVSQNLLIIRYIFSLPGENKQK